MKARSIVHAEPASTVSELIERYNAWAKTYYVKNGRPTVQCRNILMVCRRIALVFGGLAPSAVTAAMVTRWLDALAEETDLCRSVINKHLTIFKHMAKWGVRYGYAPTEFFAQIQTVQALKKGRSAAYEPAPREAVQWKDFSRALRFVESRQVAGILLTCFYSGCRVGEIVQARVNEIDTSATTWFYSPRSHKTQHHNQARVIAFGPSAQTALAPFLIGRDGESYVFCSTSARREASLRSMARRRTPMNQGSKPGSNRTKDIELESRPFRVDTINLAVRRACKKAGVSQWVVHELRHSAATRFVEAAGIEAAAKALGHASSRTTEAYTHLGRETIASLAERAG